MKISYLITCSTETKTLTNLLKQLVKFGGEGNEIVVVLDEANANESNETYIIVGAFHHTMLYSNQIMTHPLNADYGAHKNFGNNKCQGDFIFQIDGDELPSEALLGDNLKVIIESNPNVELFFVPRINDFRGVNEENSKQWGWKLDMSPTYKRLRVNWPDYQGRIYKNEPARIKWDRKLHEKIEGHNEYSFLPAEEDYALYHDKTIEKQIETNIRYNKVFTEAENRGHNVV